MSARNISKIILYSSGLVTCLDNNNHQSPSLQGFFNDVRNNLEKLFGPDEVEWFFCSGDVKNIGFNKWIEKGEEITRAGIVVNTRPISPEIVKQMRIKSVTMPPQSDKSRQDRPQQEA